jgi:DHA1 family tetracycline resistance protein-like MFS transporter
MEQVEKTGAETLSEEKLDKKKILPIFVIVLVDLLGLTLIIPLLPLYAASFAATPMVIGMLGAAYPLMQFIGAPVLGRLSDRYGRRPVLLISQLGTLIGFLMLGFASTLWMLFLSRIIDGISGANIATAQAAITDSTTEKNRTQGLGLIGAAFGIGFIIGPVIAFISLEASGNNYAVPAFIAAGFSLLSILLTYFWLPETLPKEARGKGESNNAFSLSALFQALRHPTVGFLLVLMFAQQIAFGGFEQLLALFTLSGLGMNASRNAIIFVYVGVIVVAVQGYFIGRWSRRFGDRRLIYLGLAALAIGLVLFSFTPRMTLPGYSKEALTAELTASGGGASLENQGVQELSVDLPEDGNSGWWGLVWILGTMIPIAVGGGILHPGINSLITKRVEYTEVGGMLGISAALLSAANAIAPLLGGAIFQTLGPGWPFLMGGLILGLLLLISLQKIKPGKEENLPSGLARSASAD